MNIQQDFKEFLQLLDDFAVEYMIDGVKYETASAGKILTRFDGLKIAFISKEDLIQNKQSTPRLKDKADVEELEKKKPDLP